MSRKMRKQLKRVAKGMIQDSLRGTQAPEVAGVFAATGQQSMTPSTLGVWPAGSTVPMGQSPSGVPGVTATLSGGQSPYVAAAEAGGGLDLTKAAKRAAKAAKKDSLVRKAQKDPLAALKRLELLQGRLQPNHPVGMHARGVVLRAKLLAREAGARGGLAKSAVSLGSPDTVAAVVNALQDCEVALGIRQSAQYWQPGQIDAQQQLRSIMSGQSSENLRGTQDPSAMSAYTSAASSLGQMLKTSGLGEETAAAEAQVRKAEASGDMVALSAAHERLTLARLKAVHMVTGN